MILIWKAGLLALPTAVFAPNRCIVGWGGLRKRVKFVRKLTKELLCRVIGKQNHYPIEDWTADNSEHGSRVLASPGEMVSKGTSPDHRFRANPLRCIVGLGGRQKCVGSGGRFRHRASVYSVVYHWCFVGFYFTLSAKRKRTDAGRTVVGLGVEQDGGEFGPNSSGEVVPGTQHGRADGHRSHAELHCYIEHAHVRGKASSRSSPLSPKSLSVSASLSSPVVLACLPDASLKNANFGHIYSTTNCRNVKSWRWCFDNPPTQAHTTLYRYVIHWQYSCNRWVIVGL